MVSLDRCAVEVMDSMAVTDGADRATAETDDNSRGLMDSHGIADEDAPHGGQSVSPDDSAALSDGRCTGPDDHDMTDAGVDCHASESDDDGSGLEACLAPSGQEYYLRRGGTPRRRSALRLSRIIARQQLLRRLSQGRNRDY